MQTTPDQHEDEGLGAEGRPMLRLEAASGRFLLGAVVVSELACVALVAALVL